MHYNPVQFGITREDSRLEARLVERFGLNKALLIGSGGCTAFHLKSCFPELRITLFDFNPAQISLIRKKMEVLGDKDNYQIIFNEELNQSGNFESLFRQWRSFIHEFVLRERDVEKIFEERSSKDTVFKILNHPYWKVSFDLFFHESLLETMFSRSAIQHAPAGTYPRYFQKAFEKGLLADDYQLNPYLQHLFLGKFLTFEGYLKQRPLNLDLELVQGCLFDVPQIEQYDLIQLSNIFDWMDVEGIRDMANFINSHMPSNKILLLRQINHEIPLQKFFPDFIYEKELSEELLQTDRSLFYSKITVLRRS